MSHQDLIAALRAQGAEKDADLRRQAEKLEATLTAEAEIRLVALEKEEEKARQAEKSRLTAAIVAKARLEARRLLAAARCRLADRLSMLARNCLYSLRDQEYEDFFAMLASEIPAESWSQVRVCPEDAVLARKYFPTTPVGEDETIIGGFELISEDGLLRIANTLEKRLERSWPTLLPRIIEEVEQESRVQ